MEARARPLRPWIAPGLLALAVLLLQLPILDRWASLMDEGHILQFADLLRRGGELYRDATLIAFPGSFYLLAGLFALFEPSVLVARWAVAVEFALFVACLFALLRGWLAAPFVALAVGLLLLYRIWAFPHWQMYSYSTTALTFVAAALLVVVADVTRADGSRARLALAGLFAGIAVACKQDYGGAAVIALNLVIAIAARTAPRPTPVLPRLLAFDGAGAVVGVVMALHYLNEGLLLEMLRQTLWNHLVGIASFEYSSLPPLLPLLGPIEDLRSTYGFAVWVPSIVFSMDWPRISGSVLYRDTIVFDLVIRALFWGPYAYVTAALLRVAWRRRALGDPGKRDAALRELALAGLAALLVYTLHKPKDWVHVSVMYWPLLCLVAVHLDALHRARPRASRALLAAAALPALLAAVYTGTLAFALHDRHDTPLPGERAHIRVTAAEARVIGGAVGYLRENTAPGTPVAVLPYFPLINFLAQRDAPHRSAYVLWPLEEVPGREEQIARALERERAPHVLYHFTQWIQFPSMESFAPDLFAYLVDHYEIDQIFTDDGWGYMLAGLAREPAAPDGTPLFPSDLAGATLSVEGPSGPLRPVESGERGRWLRRDVWPFREVLALRPHARGYRTVVASPPLRVPPGARLVTAVGVNPKRWFKFPPSAVRFGVRIARGGAREEIFSRELDPHRRGGERGWFDVSLPLERFAGEEVRIELFTETEHEDSEVFEMGGFAWPRVEPALGDASVPVAGSPPRARTPTSRLPDATP